MRTLNLRLLHIDDISPLFLLVKLTLQLILHTHTHPLSLVTARYRNGRYRNSDSGPESCRFGSQRLDEHN